MPRLFIVRYKRTSKVDDLNSVKKPKTKNIWKTFHEEDENKASQLVAKYNGTEDLQEVQIYVLYSTCSAFLFKNLLSRPLAPKEMI